MKDDGIYLSLSRAEYDAEPRDNWSRVKRIAQSPAHYKAALEEEDDDTAARKFGRCVHLAILEPQKFDAEVAVWSGGIRRGKEWDAFSAQHAGKELITAEEFGRCRAMAEAVLGNEHARKYLVDGAAEVSVFWTQKVAEGLEVKCKARLDYLSPALALVDLKSTRNAEPGAFFKDAYQRKYHAQCAWYRDGYFAVTGSRLPFKLVAVETEAPHVVTVLNVPESVLAAGRAECAEMLMRLSLCRLEDRWGGYVDEEIDLELPHYARPEFLPEEMAHE